MAAGGGTRPHHFTRWFTGHDPDEARAALFPGKLPSEVSQAVDGMSPRQLRELFGSIFGSPTTSNNTSWMRQKLKNALGLGAKKPRPGAGGSGGPMRKRGSPGRPIDATPTAGAPPAPPFHASPAPDPQLGGSTAATGLLSFTAAHPGPWGGGSGGGAADSLAAFPRMHSSEAEDTLGFVPPASWDSEQDRSFEEGAATLLAAAAEVDSQAAAEAAAAADAVVAAVVGPTAFPRAAGAPAVAADAAHAGNEAGLSAEGEACGESITPERRASLPAAASGELAALLAGGVAPLGSNQAATLCITSAAPPITIMGRYAPAPSAPYLCQPGAAPPITNINSRTWLSGPAQLLPAVPAAVPHAAPAPQWAQQLGQSPVAHHLIEAAQRVLLETLLAAAAVSARGKPGGAV